MDITVRTSLRKKKRELFDALGDNILRYIAELVTNADDSYKRLGDSAPENKLILIELKKDPKNKEGGYMLSVTDNAEGMSTDRLEKVFGTYGNDNADGLDSHARGIFGQGASDVLQAAANEQLTAMIETIKDGVASKLLYSMNENLEGKISVNPLNLSNNRLEQLRNSLSIPVNGTRISFGIPSNVKLRRKTLENLPELMNKYPSFRYLLNQEDVKVIYINGKSKTILSSKEYQFNQETLLSEDSFSFNFDGKPINCKLKTYLNDNKKDDGTNIIVRDENFVVYDNTMFDFKNTAASQNVSGELIINGLYRLCYNHLNSETPDAIISDNRTGFDQKNPFYQALNKALNPFLSDVIAKNGKDIKSTNLNNNKKFNSALKKLNQYLKSELKDSITDDGGNLSGKTPPIEGIKFARNNISITQGKQYDLKLLINTSIISQDEKINISCDSDRIEFSPTMINYDEQDVEDGIAIKSVVIKGIELTEEPIILKATTETRTATATIDVIEEDIHYPEDGFEFYPKEIVLSGSGKHAIKLYIDSSIVPIDSMITITCDGLQHANEDIFCEANLVNDSIGVINVAVSGGEIGENYEITAMASDKSTTATITIIEESKNEPQGNGLISGIKLEAAKDMYFQSYYDLHTHEIVINTENPINKHIMGSMDDKDKENPTFGSKQSKYLCDIISNQAALVLVKTKNIRNGEINFEDFETAFDGVQALVQQQKNKIYDIFYPIVVGESDVE